MSINLIAVEMTEQRKLKSYNWHQILISQSM